jgi:hypothetical protein
MGLVWPGVPQALVLHLRDKFRVRYFVETGTYLGETAHWASRHFQSVWTIEAHRGLYRSAVQRFSTEKHVSVLHGRSQDCLKSVVPLLEEPTIFWFDAHWSGVETYGNGEECPLLGELRVVNSSLLGHFLLIDDANLFLSPPPPPHSPPQWPDLVAVVRELDQQERYVVIVDDVIVAAPPQARSVLTAFARQRRQQQAETRGQTDGANASSWFDRAVGYLRKLARQG